MSNTRKIRPTDRADEDQLRSADEPAAENAKKLTYLVYNTDVVVIVDMAAGTVTRVHYARPTDPPRVPDFASGSVEEREVIAIADSAEWPAAVVI